MHRIYRLTYVGMLSLAGAGLAGGCASNDCKDTATCSGEVDASSEAASQRDSSVDNSVDLPGETGLTDRAPSDVAVELGSLEPNEASIEAALPEASGPCVPNGPESCFNGKDDDCNGLTDCADPICAPGAVCVPSAGDAPLGVRVAADAPCPAAYPEATLLKGNLDPGSCGGCQCGPLAVRCSADLYTYGQGTCNADMSLTGGSKYPTPVGTDCLLGSAVFWGYRMAELKAVEGCFTSGSPTLHTATFAASAKFCRTNAVGAGCASGNVCVPRDDNRRCALPAAPSTCGAGYNDLGDWYTGATDDRVCGCSCTAQGGSCDRMKLAVGGTQDCPLAPYTNTVGLNEKKCIPETENTVYFQPGVKLEGSITPSTCTATSKVTSGELKLNGASRLCCAP